MSPVCEEAIHCASVLCTMWKSDKTLRTDIPSKRGTRKNKKWGLVCRRLLQPLGKTSATVGTDWHHLPCSQRQRESDQTHQHLLNKSFFQPTEMNMGFQSVLEVLSSASQQICVTLLLCIIKHWI